MDAKFIRFTRRGWQFDIKRTKNKWLGKLFSVDNAVFLYSQRGTGTDKILVFSLLLEISAADIAHYHFG